MVKGIGVDIIKVERISDILSRSGRKFLRKVFTQREISKSPKMPESEATYFATLFAAKESILKAFGIGWRGASGRDIDVRQDKFGAPLVKLGGELAKLAKRKGVVNILISLSYDSGYAVAVCVLVGK